MNRSLLDISPSHSHNCTQFQRRGVGKMEGLHNEGDSEAIKPTKWGITLYNTYLTHMYVSCDFFF